MTQRIEGTVCGQEPYWNSPAWVIETTAGRTRTFYALDNESFPESARHTGATVTFSPDADGQEVAKAVQYQPSAQ